MNFEKIREIYCYNYIIPSLHNYIKKYKSALKIQRWWKNLIIGYFRVNEINNWVSYTDYYAFNRKKEIFKLEVNFGNIENFEEEKFISYNLTKINSLEEIVDKSYSINCIMVYFNIKLEEEDNLYTFDYNSIDVIISNSYNKQFKDTFYSLSKKYKIN